MLGTLNAVRAMIMLRPVHEQKFSDADQARIMFSNHQQLCGNTAPINFRVTKCTLLFLVA